MSIISVITDPEVGGTFLTWSLAWLSGQTTYFHVNSNKFEPLTNNPLTNINAHNFLANHYPTLTQLKTAYDKLEMTPTSHQHFVYWHNLRNEDRSYPPDPSLDKVATEIAFAKSKKCVVVKLSPRDFLYKVGRHRVLRPKFNSSQKNQTFDEQNEDFIDFFYAESKQHWRDVLQATEVWDRREFLALNLRPFDLLVFDQVHLAGRQYFLLDAADCYLTLEHTMTSLFEYLEIKIDYTRWDHWLSVYRQWQRFHVDRLKFAWYFQDIIDAVISGANIDLNRFNLDLYQEAAIQHVLLYQHNLNLKTHQLVKFNSTAQLHHLLEPNTHHILDKVY